MIPGRAPSLQCFRVTLLDKKEVMVVSLKSSTLRMVPDFDDAEMKYKEKY